MANRLYLIAAAMGVLVPVLALAGGCGPSVEVDADTSGAGGAGGEAAESSSSTGPIWDAGKDGLPPIEDPGCPNAPPPIEDFQCDPFDQLNGGCFPGEGCYIFVDYPPPGEPCSQEIYGAICAPAGFGVQGDPCGNGEGWCAAGFACVVTGSGTQCVKLCPLKGNDNCPSGLVCEPIDVEGFGGCL